MTSAAHKAPAHKQRVRQERDRLLDHYIQLTDKAMVGLALIWIGLMIADFLGALTPPLVILNNVIWALFGVDFAVKFILAPQKTTFLRQHWILALSLVLPAFRLLRVLQALGALRALSVLRILTQLNVGMGALAREMGKRGVGYVTIATLVVLFAGAAGMYSFEQPSQLVAQGFADVARSGGGLHSYSDAVWWTAMLMTTIGSAYWPVTMAGRALCFFLSIYSLGVFGYITATLASFFVDTQKSVSDANAEVLGEIHAELRALRREIKKHDRV